MLETVIDRYEQTTGQSLIRNTSPKNYEPIARLLSAISNELPHTADTLQHDSYAPDPNPRQVGYPHRRYDITGIQVKDAYNRLVANPRPFLVDACYIYLYGMGRRGFAENPQDPNLIAGVDATVQSQLAEQEVLRQQLTSSQQLHRQTVAELQATLRRSRRLTWLSLGVGVGLVLLVGAGWLTDRRAWAQLRHDMSLLPYQPTAAEIDSLSGIWLYYTGAPQARFSDSARYHQVANNLVEITYQDGYFRFYRHGANIDHVGYMQFEGPGLVSLHSHTNTETGRIESPIHALMRLDEKRGYLSSIATTWTFDRGRGNDLIGIRNIFIKQGRGGHLSEIANTPENAHCHCKIMQWQPPAGRTRQYPLQYKLLDTLADTWLRPLIDEHSILLRDPARQGLLRVRP
ncbi:hypothetical protein GCM10027578_01020 [Spirosoma luteolum]